MRPLSPRQDEVSNLVAKGYTNLEIATELNIRQGTVKQYIHQAFRSVGVNNRTALAIWVIHHRKSVLS